MHRRLTIVHDDTGPVEDTGLCDCGVASPCNLACIFGSEVQARKDHAPLKLLGRMELEPGEYIHNGQVWYCADRLSTP